MPIAGNEKETRYVEEKINPTINVGCEIFIEMGEKDSEEYLRLMQKYITVYRKKMEYVLQDMRITLP